MSAHGPSPYLAHGPSKRIFARKKSHEEENEEHKVHFSIHDSVWWCASCDWMEFSQYSEEEIDRLVGAEYENCRNKMAAAIDEIGRFL